MRLFLWLLALMAAAIGIAVTARFNPGNVVLFYPPHRIDLSLNFFVVIEVALFAVLYLAIRAFRATIKMPGRVAAYRLRKRERDGNKGLRDALKALFEGRFGHAEKAALRAADLPENAGVAALIGARAAHRMRQTDRRDNWLFELRNDPSMKTARLMTMTELLVDDHQPEATVDRIKPFVASRAATALNERGLHDEARLVAEEALAASWDERVVRAYREAAAPAGSPALLAQIEHCEGWINARPTDAELALTLGSLCLKQKLWGKAQRYLEQALSDASDARMVREAHLKLAQMHDALQQPEEAASHYRQCALATIL